MTTIAFDGTTMAADRRKMRRGLPIAGSPKIVRLTDPNGKPALLGVAGSGAALGAIEHWLQGGQRPEQGEEWVALLVDHEKRIWVRQNDSMGWHHIERKQWAVGSGADFALTAMRCGRTSGSAVEIAAEFDVDTGDGVDVLRLTPNLDEILSRHKSIRPINLVFDEKGRLKDIEYA